MRLNYWTLLFKLLLSVCNSWEIHIYQIIYHLVPDYLSTPLSNGYLQPYTLWEFFKLIFQIKQFCLFNLLFAVYLLFIGRKYQSFKLDLGSSLDCA